MTGIWVERGADSILQRTHALRIAIPQHGPRTCPAWQWELMSAIPLDGARTWAWPDTADAEEPAVRCPTVKAMANKTTTALTTRSTRSACGRSWAEPGVRVRAEVVMGPVLCVWSG